MVTFCVDRFVNGRPYPNLARWEAIPYTPGWRQFSQRWPYSEPVHFFEYLDVCNIPYQFVDSKHATQSTLYPISISFFDFDIDWFAMLPNHIIDKLRNDTITLWFFYSEGDNPARIQQHLFDQAKQANISCERIRMTTANTSSQSLTNFSYFADDECLYWLRNKERACEFSVKERSKKFTALVRTHKWWRAATMARIWGKDLHNHGYFSYSREIDIEDNELDNPIELDLFGDLRQKTYDFLGQCPFHADNLDSSQHNAYDITVKEHFEDSYLNLIIETHMDVDQSGGVFLTEKTFKPIKNCQPFIILGAAGSLSLLRSMGYRTFDHVINHSYDLEPNTTKRWDQAMKEFEKLLTKNDLHDCYLRCREDLEHNQKLFLSDKTSRLNTLLGQITKL